MPIAKPHANHWCMPVVVPDSTVNYAIRVKRISAAADIIVAEKE